ncbi:hypothetical protein [Actinocrispum sp. NPDC049592]|uniref:hypothetical protein n=1 Tax=Actinocrispum sp. NPDC049592 TaxID=3154835 RepID=UPI003440CC05
MSNPTTESEDFDLELPGKPTNPDVPTRPQGPVSHDDIQTLVAKTGTPTRPTGPVSHDVVLPAGDRIDRPMGPVSHDGPEPGDGDGSGDGGATTDGPVSHDTDPTGP